MNKQVKRYCAYYRVSTGEQGKSGLGLSAQRKAVLDYINGGAEIVKSFQETESGKRSDRPQLKLALDYCKTNGTILIVSKLDRLARSLWLFESIKQSGIDFEIVGLPKNPLVQQVLASVAEWEARAISERTKSALAELKSQGVPLGYNNPRVRKGLEKRWKAQRTETAKRKAKEKAERIKKRLEERALKAQSASPSARQQADSKVLEPIKILRQQGFSYEKIAKALNKNGTKTRRGCQWNQSQVIRVCKRNGL